MNQLNYDDIKQLRREAKDVVDILAYARVSQGLSKSEFAKLCGLSRQSLISIESKKSSPSLATIQEMASQLGLELQLVAKTDNLAGLQSYEPKKIVKALRTGLFEFYNYRNDRHTQGYIDLALTKMALRYYKYREIRLAAEKIPLYKMIGPQIIGMRNKREVLRVELPKKQQDFEKNLKLDNLNVRRGPKTLCF
jgi:transcriptional regulator with XRE-family HTH domain